MRDKAKYLESLRHWRKTIERVGLVRVERIYSDALFRVSPQWHLDSLRDAIDEVKKVK